MQKITISTDRHGFQALQQLNTHKHQN